MEDFLAEAIAALNGDELYALVAVEVSGLTETDTAGELSQNRGTSISRNWVHRRRLTALQKMRRAHRQAES